ncbi:hypothetical protein DFJ73DRAFT_827395 [Zopfochytrium polystomum]|nr:hypothetical protein DFJ73DRAFT_827395 [Zopfochytrium polystomum]
MKAPPRKATRKKRPPRKKTSPKRTPRKEEEEEEKPVSKKRAAESAAQSAAKKTKSDAAEPATTIFLGNLPWSADEDSIAAEFADCGEVTSVRLHVDRKTQRKKGFAHVTFATKEGAKAAVELGSKTIDGRDVRIDFAAPAPTPSTPRPKTEGGLGRVEQRSKSSPTEIVFVANLPFSATEDALAEFFGEHGTVVSTRIPTDRESGRPKGFAHVTFASVGDAKAALEALNGADFGGRTIRLDFSSPRDRSSGGGGGGFGGAGRGGRGGFGGGRGGNGGFGGRDGGSRGSGRGGRQRF